MKLIACAVFFALLIVSSHGWGNQGHAVVGLIAQFYLSPSAKKAVNIWTGGKTLGDIASQPDDYRSTPQGKWSSALHYADVPDGQSHFSMKFCPNNVCVVGAINNFTRILNITPPHQWNSPHLEPSPLSFLTHFVGDVHQPLHVGHEKDRGGNDVKVNFFGKETNLHSLWDGGLLNRYNLSNQALANMLINEIEADPAQKKKWMSNRDPVSWADESFQLVLSTVYNFSNMRSSSINLGESYYRRCLPIVFQRLSAGGLRLAAILNSIYP